MKHKLPIVLVVSILIITACSNNDNAILQKRTEKCIILGNSITLHSICEYWWGEWGMAASTRENDFVHKLENKIRTNNKNIKCTPTNIAAWEQSLDINSIDLMTLKIYDYDYIIIRLGENISNDTESIVCEKAFKELIDNIRNINSSANIFITGVFWPNASKESAIKNVASSENIKYINIDKFCIDKNVHTIGDQVFGDDGQLHTINNDDVASHPNDSGMEAIAEELYNAIFL